MSATASIRLTGHELANEGSPHDAHGRRTDSFRSTAGEGRGKCSCGTLSPFLPSATQRKAWHRTHKDEIRGMPDPTPSTTDVYPILGTVKSLNALPVNAVFFDARDTAWQVCDAETDGTEVRYRAADSESFCYQSASVLRYGPLRLVFTP